jgi:hypothetical protein
LVYSNLYLVNVGDNKIRKIAIATAVVSRLTDLQKLCRSVAHMDTN